MIAIIDTGLPELHNIQEALGQNNYRALITSDEEKLSRADQLILYSTSTFGSTMYGLQEKGLDSFLKQSVINGKKLLGIGIGMQVFFTGSDEGGFHQGLNLLPGHVVPFEDQIPGMSWISFKYPHPLIRGKEEGYGYFSNAYYVKAVNNEDVIGLDEQQIPSIVGRRNLLGIQFYPDKSGDWGKQWLLQREICKK